MTVRLTRLAIYPIKACAGIWVSRAALAPTGLRYDRRWMLVDEAGRFVTQRDLPRLCLVKTAFSKLRNGEPDSVSVRMDGQAELELPLQSHAGSERPVQIWRSSLRALEHAEGSAWFSRAFCRELGLVYLPDANVREVEQTRGRPGEVVGFADAYPLLLVSEASLARLNERAGELLTMDRFRPNLVVEGCRAHAEDDWGNFRVGEVPMRAVKACERCAVPTVDPNTGERGKEPLKTLAEYRKVGGQVLFGVNVIHETLGNLSVGDALRL